MSVACGPQAASGREVPVAPRAGATRVPACGVTRRAAYGLLATVCVRYIYVSYRYKCYRTTADTVRWRASRARQPMCAGAPMCGSPRARTVQSHASCSHRALRARADIHRRAAPTDGFHDWTACSCWTSGHAHTPPRALPPLTPTTSHCLQTAGAGVRTTTVAAEDARARRRCGWICSPAHEQRQQAVKAATTGTTTTTCCQQEATRRTDGLSPVAGLAASLSGAAASSGRSVAVVHHLFVGHLAALGASAAVQDEDDRTCRPDLHSDLRQGGRGWISGVACSPGAAVRPRECIQTKEIHRRISWYDGCVL